MIIKPWQTVGDIRARGYAIVTDLDTLSADAKRLRKTLYFIADPSALAKTETVCPHCKKVVAPEHSNLAEYYPARKTYKVMHYVCAWGGLFEEIFDAHDRGLI